MSKFQDIDPVAAGRPTDSQKLDEERSKVKNDIGVCLTNALGAASDINIAIAQAPRESNAEFKAALMNAMHHALIIAEQCRQHLERRSGNV